MTPTLQLYIFASKQCLYYSLSVYMSANEDEKYATYESEWLSNWVSDNETRESEYK